MKKLKYLLFIFILFLTPCVFADDFNVSSSITSPSGSPSAGGYEGLEIYNSGSTNRYAINTRYNGRLSRIRFNVPLPNNWSDGDCFSSGDLNYTLTLKMATNDWRNNFGTIFISNNSSGTNWFTSFSYVSRQQIKINFKIPTTENCYDFLYVDIQSKNLSSTAFTGETNWDLKSVVLTANFPSSGGGSGSSGATNQDIINNNNQNTQDIINNNNQNTQDIIDNNNDNTQQIIENQNQNTQQQIDSQKVCNQIDKSSIVVDNHMLNSIGSLMSGYNSYGITDYINIQGATIKVTTPTTGSGGFAAYYCFYNTNKTRISCTNIGNLELNSTISIPSNAVYFRSSIYKDTNKPTFNICQNGNQAISDYLSDDSDPSIDDSSLNEVFGKVHFTDPLGYLLTLPTQLINQIVSMSDTCSAIDLGTLYGVHLTLPCINLENYLGSDLWNILDIILSVGLLSVIFKNFYDTISNLLTLGGQKEAKEKFSMPTPMDFLAMILGGDNK